MPVCISVCLTELFNFNCRTIHLGLVDFPEKFSFFSSLHASDLEFWGYSEVTLWVPWDHIKGTPGSLCGCFVMTLRVLCEHLGFIFGTTFEVLWGHLRVPVSTLVGTVESLLVGYPGGVTLGVNIWSSNFRNINKHPFVP